MGQGTSVVSLGAVALRGRVLLRRARLGSLISSVLLLSAAGRDSPRRATYFLLLRQKNVSKEKATRSLGPFASLRATCGARAKRGQKQLAFGSNKFLP